MKKNLLFLLFCGCLGAAEWIEPPILSSKGYKVPRPDYEPSFPADHGAHREYGLEWWYWIGHLKTESGEKEYGFQSTVFRVAGDPNESNNSESNAFGNKQLFLAHAALSNLSTKQYLHNERVVREGWQARASTDTLAYRLQGSMHRWHLMEKATTHTRYPNGGIWNLTLTPTKPLIRFGDRGLSRKGDGASSVSWYWTYTRLKAEGTLTQDGKTEKVEGLAWMDHEISSSQLGKGLAGWDWTCMQLDDGTEVKAYRLRKDDGTSDRWSAVYWIDEKGGVQQVYADQFTWEEEDEWTSPTTGLSYPTTVRIKAQHPNQGMQTYRLRPLLDNQEFTGNRADNAYWEGACEVLDAEGRVIGKAYLELAGYGGGLGARLN